MVVLGPALVWERYALTTQRVTSIVCSAYRLMPLTWLLRCTRSMLPQASAARFSSQRLI